MADSHYIPYFAEMIRACVYRAVCGRSILEREHSADPSCSRCKAWLEADDQLAHELAAKWDAEDAAKIGAHS